MSAHRKVVTVLFCDVVGSTTLGESVDPEALQGLLARYFERMKAIVESHGGSVEKFIGDAVMAVFGVPVAHEDDALRACRAAVEMRDALPELEVKGRIGVNTGEVLTGTEERLATGDAVNVAARLEQAAQPGEVLIGSETLALVQDAAEVGEERQLELKGKSEPVAAHALAAVLDPSERSHASRFVGRERELQQLVNAWDRAVVGPRCELVTVVGEPGVGKSRLVTEALGRIDARVVRGRCLSYGEGITYWPVVEIVRQLAALPADEQAARAIRSLLGAPDLAAGTDEIAWAFRKLLEEQAPLVVCFDDIQWGEETFLDLVDSIALLSTGAPLLLVCMARPELLDRRSGWPATLRLEPLPEADAEALVGDAVPEEARRQIVLASGGNPLFLTEMVALSDAGRAEVEVPASLRALLAARLDQLDASERRVLERGAVEGELFHRGTVQALTPEETQVTPRLAALVRRDLVSPDTPVLPREDAYRFRHLLIRDTAYDALPKATRADLHRRFADWLQEHGESLVELDEILGYHLEQAALYLVDLGRADTEVALAACARLRVAGRHALARGDSAAVNLLTRAVSLAEEAEALARAELLLDLSDALVAAGDLASAADLTGEAAELAGSSRDRALELRARCERDLIRGATDPEFTGDAQIEAGRQALRALAELGDDAGQAAAWRLVASGENVRADWDRMAQALEQALPHARRAGDRRREHEILRELALSVYWGSTPVAQALPRCEQMLEQSGDSGQLRAVLLACLGGLHGMEGRLEKARALLDEAETMHRDLGSDLFVCSIGFQRGPLELAAGDPVAAEAVLRSNCEGLQKMGETGWLSTLAAYLAQALYEQGRLDEAESWVKKAREVGAADDTTTQMLWRQSQALICARRGKHGEGERLVHEALEMVDRTDQWNERANARMTLAEVCRLAGRLDEAADAAAKAQEYYERKGNCVMAERARALLAALQPD